MSDQGHLDNEAKAQSYGLLPEEEKYKIRDIFIKLLDEHGYEYEVHGLEVDPHYWKPDHPEVLKIIGDMPYHMVKLQGTKATKKLWNKIVKAENRQAKKLQRKALMMYFKGEGVM